MGATTCSVAGSEGKSNRKVQERFEGWAHHAKKV
jgi:hypothetical protein